MRSLLVWLFALAVFASAQSSVVPDVSVIGVSTITVTGDVGVMVPKPSTSTTPATVTQCWRHVTTESSTTRVAVQPTLVDGEYPPDIECWLVYQGDGGIISLPIPQKADPSTSNNGHSDRAVTPALPIALSLVGVVLLAGGVLVFFHIRNRKRRAANRASGGKRAWVNRKAGWAKMADEGAEIARPAVARVAYY